MRMVVRQNPRLSERGCYACKRWCAWSDTKQTKLLRVIVQHKRRWWSWWFNELGENRWHTRHKTPRGKVFTGSHAHSIVKKKKVLNERVNRQYKPTISNCFLWHVEKNASEWLILVPYSCGIISLRHQFSPL